MTTYNELVTSALIEMSLRLFSNDIDPAFKIYEYDIESWDGWSRRGGHYKDLQQLEERREGIPVPTLWEYAASEGYFYLWLHNSD